MRQSSGTPHKTAHLNGLVSEALEATETLRGWLAQELQRPALLLLLLRLFQSEDSMLAFLKGLSHGSAPSRASSLTPLGWDAAAWKGLMQGGAAWPVGGADAAAWKGLVMRTDEAALKVSASDAGGDSTDTGSSSLLWQSCFVTSSSSMVWLGSENAGARGSLAAATLRNGKASCTSGDSRCTNVSNCIFSLQNAPTLVCHSC